MTRYRFLLAPAWDALVAFAATVAVVVVPVTLFPGFDYVLTRASLVEWGLTAVFAADVAVQLRRRRHRSARRRESLSTVLDVLAALPTVALGLPAGFEVLRLLKLYRVVGLMQAYARRHPGQASHLRLSYFVYWIGVVVHLIACGFVQIGGVPGASTDVDRYVYALYWSVTTLTTVGYGDVPLDSTLLRLYGIGVMVLGVGAYAFLIGNIASLLSSMDPLRAAHDARRERVASFLRYRRLPPSLQARVHAYLDLAWEEGFAVDEEEALAGLPPGLREAVVLHLRRDLLRAVPLFAEASEAFVREVALQMTPFVCLPGDVIVHLGDHGREMFVIARGRVEVVGARGQRYRTLRAGDFFGEIALFENAVRSATVRALDPSDLYVLDRDLFERVLEDYPDVAATLRDVAAERSGVRGDPGAAPGADA